MELLSPAGNYEAFIGAVNAGCDAVYLGGSKYGARAYADNFTDEEIIRAINYAHFYNVKVYLTVNTLIKENELEDVCEYIDIFYREGLDACIVQDLGLMSVFKSRFPDMELHVSTQAFATDLNGALFYKSLGASRIVLARELSLQEIKYINDNLGLETETFIHGAMCYSYSGQCLMSSCIGGRSGNRGRCAGTCRLPYSVNTGNKQYDDAFYLSMKDQCALELIPRLFEAGISSLKIEGRMKSPEYTAFVTSVYRKYIDLYVKDPGNFHVDKKDIAALKKVYLRSEISSGYYNLYNGPEMLTLKNPGYNGNDDALIEKIRTDFLSELSKLEISVRAFVKVNEPLKLTIKYKDTEINVTGDTVYAAKNQPVSKTDVIKHLSKFGDSVFYPSCIDVGITGDCFVPVKALNELRRKGTEELLKSRKRITFDKCIKSDSLIVRKHTDIKGPLYFVMQKGQLDALNSKLSGQNIIVHHSLIDTIIPSAYAGNDIFTDLPHVTRNKDLRLLEEIFGISSEIGIKGFVVHNFSELEFLNEKGYDGTVVAGSELYAFNRASYDFLKERFDAVIAPLELTFKERSLINGDYYEIAYGRMPLMHSANCLMKTTEGCRKGSGPLFMTLTDRKNASFPVFRDCNVCENIIFNCLPVSLHEEASLKRINKDFSVFYFTDENEKTVSETVELFEQAFKGKENLSTGSAFTRGYRKRGVE